MWSRSDGLPGQSAAWDLSSDSLLLLSAFVSRFASSLLAVELADSMWHTNRKLPPVAEVIGKFQHLEGYSGLGDTFGFGFIPQKGYGYKPADRLRCNQL